MAPETENGDGESIPKTVFIDTSFDTHLATLVSDSDTVSDLKKKVVLQHRQCFPAFGDIKVNCLKVKRRGNYYHMADSMLLKSAFSAIKSNWFVSVDASRLDQAVTIQPSDKRKAGDQLALPWVTDSQSNDRHDNHGSPSGRPKMVPFVSKKSPNGLTSGDSRKNVSKRSKKRTRDVDNDSLPEGASRSGLFVKRIRKTQTGEGNVKASEEGKVSTFNTAKGINNDDSFEHKLQGKDSTDESTRINQGENCNGLDQLAIVVPSQDVSGEMKSQKDVEISETVPDVAMAVEQNIQQDMPSAISQKEKENELVQKTAAGNELPSSMRTSDYERSTKHKAAETESSLTSFIQKLDSINKDVIDSSQRDVGSTVQESAGDQIVKLKQGPEVNISEKRRRGKKTAAKKNDESLVKRADNVLDDNDISSAVSAPVFDEKVMDERDEVSAKTLIDDSRKGEEMIVKEVEVNVIDSSQQDVGSTDQECAGDQIDKEKQGQEVKLPEKRKRPKKTAAIKKDESIVKRADNLLANKDITTVPAPVFDEKVIEEREEVSEKTLIDDSKKGDEMIVKEVEISEPTESLKSQVHEENPEENSKTVLKDSVGVKKKKKNVGESASRNDESVVKHTSDAAPVTNEEIVLPQSERKESLEITSTDADILRNKNDLSQVNAEGIVANSEKQNDTVGSRKTKKSASRNDESVIKHTIDAATVANEEIVLTRSERKESPEITLTDADISGNENNVSQVIAGIIDNLEKQNDSVRSKRKKKSASRNDESVIKHTSNAATVTNEEIVLSQSERKESPDITLTDAEISRNENDVSQVNAEGIADNSEKQNDTVKSRKKKKSASGNDESVIKHTSDAATVTNEEIVLSQSERIENPEIILTDAELFRKEKNASQINAEGIADNSEKQNGTVKSRRKKKLASRNDESVIKHTSDAATVTNEEIVLSQSERKESLDITLMDAESSRNEKNVSQVKAGIDGNSEKQNDTMDGTKKSKKKRKTKKDAAINENDLITKHDSDIRENVKEAESSLPDDDKVKEKDAQIFDERVVKKVKKNKKPSITVTPPQDLPSGNLSAELELESKKSQTVDHDHLPEEASKNATVSKVSKGNNEANIPKDESHKIDFMDYFTPGHQPDKNSSVDGGKDDNLSVREKRSKKKTFKPPHLETTIQSQNIISENQNSSSKDPTDVVRDPNKNIDQFKTPKKTKKSEPLKTMKSVHQSSSSSSLKSFDKSVPDQKSNKQESVVTQTRVDTTKKSAPVVKSLLNTPGTIFGNDNDESSADDNAAVNSDSSTRTPSRTSSSSGESDSSLDSRRNGSQAVKRKIGGANSSMNSQSKKMSMSDLLRSSSRFKKAKLTASQGEDTESQQVDFVPESQFMT